MRQLGFGILVLGMSIGSGCMRGDNLPDNWMLENDASSLHFQSTKNTDIIETHTFHTLDGRVTSDGIAKIRVELDSVETNIPVRNERMRTVLFETMKTPEMGITSQINMTGLGTLNVGDVKNQTINIDIALHGTVVTKPIKVKISRLSKNKVEVRSVNPILVEAGDFGLDIGVDELRKLAGLNAISYTVPVSFDLVFVRG